MTAFADCVSLLMSFDFLRNKGSRPQFNQELEGSRVLPGEKPRAAPSREPLLQHFIRESNTSSLEFSIRSEMLRLEVGIQHRFEIWSLIYLEIIIQRLLYIQLIIQAGL